MNTSISLPAGVNVNSKPRVSPEIDRTVTDVFVPNKTIEGNLTVDQLLAKIPISLPKPRCLGCVMMVCLSSLI